MRHTTEVHGSIVLVNVTSGHEKGDYGSHCSNYDAGWILPREVHDGRICTAASLSP